MQSCSFPNGFHYHSHLNEYKYLRAIKLILTCGDWQPVSIYKVLISGLPVFLSDGALKLCSLPRLYNNIIPAELNIATLYYGLELNFILRTLFCSAFLFLVLLCFLDIKKESLFVCRNKEIISTDLEKNPYPNWTFTLL